MNKPTDREQISIAARFPVGAPVRQIDPATARVGRVAKSHVTDEHVMSLDGEVLVCVRWEPVADEQEMDNHPYWSRASAIAPLTDRDQTIQGLRELADFLDANPDLPVNSWSAISYSVDSSLNRSGRASSADRRAEVDRIAAILGVDPVDDRSYAAARMFAGRVEYRAVSCNPGPKPGLCSECETRPVHRPGSELVTGRTCTTCLTPRIAEAIDRAAAIHEAHAAANLIEAETAQVSE